MNSFSLIIIEFLLFDYLPFMEKEFVSLYGKAFLHKHAELFNDA